MRTHVAVAAALVLAVAAAGVAGCRFSRDSAAGGSSTDVMVTASDFGTTKQLPLGHILDLAIADNPSTGYSWHYSWEPKAGLRVFSINDVGAHSRKPGSGSTQHIRFLAQQTGTVTITLQHGRWSEGGDREPPVTLTVQVTQ